MRSQGQFRKWMVIALETDGHGRAYLADYLDAGTCLADTETLACQYLLIAAGMELGEAGAELKLLPVDHDRAVGALLALDGILRQVVRGMNSSSALGTERVEPFVKLRFPDAGGHRLTLRYSCTLLDRVDGLPSMPENPAVWEKRRGWFWKFGRITFKGRGLGLFPGHEEPLTRLDAAKPQEEHAALSPELTDWSGAKLNLEIVNLPDGPAEVELLIGDPSKAEKVLGWKRKVDYKGLCRMMMEKDLERAQNGEL